MNLNDLFTEEKVRLDPKCWTGKKIGNPKTKMKGGVRVNNCVPAESVAEGVMYGAENLHVGDDVVITGDVEFNGATGVINSFGQDKRFVVVDLYNHGRHSFHSSDVSANDHDNDEHDDDMTEGQLELNTPNPVVVVQDLKGNILDTLNLSVAAQKYQLGNPQNVKNQLAHQSYTKIGNYTISAPIGGQPQDQTTTGQKNTFATVEGEQKPGADYRDPKEVDYDDEYDAMVARVKRLAGLGPMKTVYDPTKRQYRNMPTAQQPKK